MFFKIIISTIFSPGGACTAGGSRNGVGEWVSGWVSGWVSQSVANFFCLNDQAYNCLIHLQSLSVYSTCVYAAQTVHTGIEQVCWHECRHCSWLLSGDDWQVRVGIAVSRLQVLDLLKETNNGRMSWAIPHSGLRWNEIIFFYSLGPWIFKDYFFNNFFDTIDWIKDEKEPPPLIIYVIDLILPCWTYSPSRGLCEFLALFLKKLRTWQDCLKKPKNI